MTDTSNERLDAILGEFIFSIPGGRGSAYPPSPLGDVKLESAR